MFTIASSSIPKRTLVLSHSGIAVSAKNSNAKKYNNLSYKEVIDNELRVMDLTAITLCKENKLPIGILDINDKKNLKNFIFSSKIIGTTIS